LNPDTGGRGHHIARHAIASYLRMAATIFVSLAITRVSLEVLKKNSMEGYSKEAYGLLAFLVALSGATAFLEEGGGDVLVRLLAQKLQSGKELQQAFSNGWAVNFAGGLFRGTILFLLTPLIPGIFKFPIAFTHTAQISLMILSAGQVLTGALRPWHSVRIAQEHFPLEFSRVFVSQVLRLGLCVIADRSPGGPFIGLVIALIFPDIGTQALLAFWQSYKNARFRVRWDFMNFDEMRSLASLGGWKAAVIASYNLFGRADQAVCTTFLGPAANSVYAVAEQLRGQILNFSTLVTGVLLPTTSKSTAGEDYERLRRLYVRATRFCVSIAVGPCVVISIFSKEFIDLWLGSGYQLVIWIIPFSFFRMLLNMPIVTAWNTYTAAGKLRSPAIANWATGLFGQGLSLFFILFLKWGLIGIYFGSLIAAMLRLIWHLFEISNFLKTPKIQIFVEALAGPSLGAAVLAVFCFVLKMAHLNLIFICTGLAVFAGVYLGWFWKGILDIRERQAVLRVMNKSR
jgi:O-antigen/teichoic acid export membrane protein